MAPSFSHISTETFGGVEIEVPRRNGEEFVRVVREVLRRLRKTSVYKETIRPNLGRIVRGRENDWKAAQVRPSLECPRVVLHLPIRWEESKPSAEWSDRLVLTLAHEARHNAIYRSIVGSGGLSGRRAWARHRQRNAGRDERACIAFELAVGREVGVDPALLDSVERLLPFLPHEDLPRLQRRRLSIARAFLKTGTGPAPEERQPV